MTMPLLSLCIPTYNRMGKVVPLVRSLLTSTRQDFEVVVVDNASTDGTFEQLSRIQDPRFRLERNDGNIGGIRNCLEALLKGMGRYSFLCLDKDRLLVDQLGTVIDELASHSTVGAGYIDLSVMEPQLSVLYSRGFPTLLRLGYLGKHPTGYFFAREHLAKMNVVARFSDLKVSWGFPYEFIFSEFCLFSEIVVIRKPLVVTETLDEAKATKSYTYSLKDGTAYFHPAGRGALLREFLKHLNTLGLSFNESTLLTKRLFREQWKNATELYRYICSEPSLCAHHGMVPRDIGFWENLVNSLRFIGSFLVKPEVPKFWTRLSIVSGYFASQTWRGGNQWASSLVSGSVHRVKLLIKRLLRMK